jgi:protein TonB
MAFVDQDRSREKLLSGLASVTLVGVVGYALVTGLAINVIRTMGHQVIVQEWPADVPPPPPPIHRTPEKAPKVSHPVFVEKPFVPPLTPTQDRLETTVTLPPPTLSTVGPMGSAQSVPSLPSGKAVDARPKGNPAEWVTTDDYPATALRNGQQGRTSFRLDIGTDGRPTACSIVQSSGSSDLDQAACRTLMRRAHFNAARDDAGAPVPSTYANNVLWRLPRD